MKGQPPEQGPVPPGLAEPWTVRRYGPGGLQLSEEDQLAAEEPLELRRAPASSALGTDTPLTATTLAVLMRTPGADRDLLRGWLHAEGLLRSGSSALPSDSLYPDPENPNLWYLAAEVPATYVARESSSACGICGSGSVERLLLRAAPLPPRPALDAAWLADLPEVLRAGQPGFAVSGGLHGASLFAANGRAPLCLFEDIGRHNAADKVIGWALDHVPDRSETALVLSSRLGYEIAQKAVLAGIGAVVGVGAATTLAAQTAATFGLLLCGFARGGRLTVYAGGEYLKAGAEGQVRR